MIDRSRVKEVTEAATQGRYPKVSDGCAHAARNSSRRWWQSALKAPAVLPRAGGLDPPRRWSRSGGGTLLRPRKTRSFSTVASESGRAASSRRIGRGVSSDRNQVDTRRLVTWTPPQAQPLDLARLPTRLSAPCRGCRADVWVEVHADWRVEVLDRVHHWDNMST